MDNTAERCLTSPKSRLAEATSLMVRKGKHEETLGIRNSLETFTLFSKLPTEIRVRIWGYACPEERIVIVRNQCRVTWIPIPLIAHINQESRSEALRIHRLGFRPTRGTCGKLWWNPLADTIFVHSSWARKCLIACETMLGPSISEVRHLALPVCGKFCNMLFTFHAELLHKFTALESLDLVVSRRHVSLKDEVFFIHPAQVIDDPTYRHIGSIKASVEEFKSLVHESGRKIATRVVSSERKKWRPSG
jgi:hypothetical protein